MSKIEYQTPGGTTVLCEVDTLPYSEALNEAFDAIDHNQGALFCSGYEYPGRYSRWDIGFIRPPIEIIGRHRNFGINALNERGKQILPMICQAIEGQAVDFGRVNAAVAPPPRIWELGYIAMAGWRCRLRSGCY